MSAIVTLVHWDDKPVAPLLAAVTELDSDSNVCCYCGTGLFTAR